MVTGPDSLFVTLLILLYSLTSESERFEVLGPTEPIVAVTGDDIILPCYLKPNISAEDMTVDWRNLDFIDDLLYSYQNGKIIQKDQVPSYRGRTSLFQEELWRGNISLKLTRVQVTDEGRYECFTKTTSWYDGVKMEVFVKAVGSRPVVSIEGHREGGMGLVCQSEGWHPEPDLVWLDSKGVSLSAGPPETHRDLKGFYTVKQHVIVQETDTNRFTCRVQQRLINEEVETEVHIPSELFDYATTWRRSFIVSCCLGVITVIGSALTVYGIHMKKGELKQELFDLRKYVFQDIRRHAVDVTLDPDTAHPKLILSEDGKQVRLGEIKQDLPDIPKRFDYSPSVLGKEGFSSGRFYYEVQVKGKRWWTVGVAQEFVKRKGWITVNPEDGFWIVRLRDGKFRAIAEPMVPLSLRKKPQKVGVFVDYEAGQVSFFNVEARCHIYSFTGCTFTEKLHPFLTPGLNDDGQNSAPLVIRPVNFTD
uniref:Butyrophilin subfamily 1 member A1-like n=3 Tax=Esox lucius TaxID=8010 RepID=A0A3P8Y8Y5_ESOLU